MVQVTAGACAPRTADRDASPRPARRHPLRGPRACSGAASGSAAHGAPRCTTPLQNPNCRDASRQRTVRVSAVGAGRAPNACDASANRIRCDGPSVRLCIGSSRRDQPMPVQGSRSDTVIPWAHPKLRFAMTRKERLAPLCTATWSCNSGSINASRNENARPDAPSQFCDALASRRLPVPAPPYNCPQSAAGRSPPLGGTPGLQLSIERPVWRNSAVWRRVHDSPGRFA